MIPHPRHTPQPTAFVTGGARGIGRGIALNLASHGFDVIVNATSPSDDAKQTVQKIQDMGQKACLAIMDISDIKCHKVVFEQAEHDIGTPLTTLVNNAGVSVMVRDNLLTVSEQSYDRCQNVNTKAMFFLCQAFVKYLLQEKTDRTDIHHSIINVTSSNAHAVSIARGEYCVSKAGASMITKLFATQFANDHIGVYEIQPGLIKTDMTASVTEKYTKLAQQGLSVINRMGTPEEIGRIAGAMAMGDMIFATGQAIQADGGLHMVRF